MKLKFDLYDTRGKFPIIISEIATIFNKLESGGGVDIQGYAFSYDMDAASGSSITRELFLSLFML